MQYIDLQMASLRKDLTTHLRKLKLGDTVYIIKKWKRVYAELTGIEKEVPVAGNSIECSLSELRPKIGEFVNDVHFNNLYVIIKQHNKPVAVLKPTENAAHHERGGNQ